jgi:HK97 family phage major capsid protein
MSVFAQTIEANLKRLDEIEKQYPATEIKPTEVLAEIETLTGQIEGAKAQLAAEEAIAAARSTASKAVAVQGKPGAYSPATSNETVVQVLAKHYTPKGQATEKPSIAHFALAVRDLKTNARLPDQVYGAMTTYVNTASPADGGVAVPGEYPQDILNIGLGVGSLAGRCAQITLNQGYTKVPVYVNAPWSVYSGTTGPAIVAEGGDISEAKPVFSYVDVTIQEAKHIVPVSNEMLRRGPASLVGTLMAGADKSLTYFINNQVIASLSGAAALKTVAIATGSVQTSKFVYQNWIDLDAAMPTDNWNSSGLTVIANEGLKPYLRIAQIPGTTTYVPLYANGKFDGKDVSFNPLSVAVGSKGDVYVADLSMIWFAQEQGGLRLDFDPYYKFVNDAGAWRWVRPFAVKPMVAAAWTYPDSVTRSPYLVLAGSR